MLQIFLDERLMRAADAALQHGEVIEVRFARLGRRERTYRVLGRGPLPGTVRLGIWCGRGELGVSRRGEITLDQCRLPLEMAIRLEMLAREQKPVDSVERLRTSIFIEIVQARRHDMQPERLGAR